MNYIRIYGELKRQEGETQEVIQYIIYHDGSLTKIMKYQDKLESLTHKIEKKLENKYGVKF